MDHQSHQHQSHQVPAKVQVTDSQRTYKCRKCRKTLATNRNVFNHSSGTQLNFQTYQEPMQYEYCKNGIFLEPMEWMKCNAENKLNCDKCDSKLGSFSWTQKVTCPCGSSMRPGCFINMKRIDISNQIRIEVQSNEKPDYNQKIKD